MFNNGPSKWLGQTGEVPVAIPDAFFIIVVKEDGSRLDVLAFLYPQEGVGYKPPPGGKYDHIPHRTSVDVIEVLTGLDFLTKVPDDVEAGIEAVVHVGLWECGRSQRMDAAASPGRFSPPATERKHFFTRGCETPHPVTVGLPDASVESAVG